MATLTRWKKSRSANRNVMQSMISKVQNIERNGLDEESRQEIADIVKAIEKKRTMITELDSKILEVIDEEEIDTEVEDTTAFDVKMIADLSAIDRIIRVKEEPQDNSHNSYVASAPVKCSRPKPPPLQIKKFTGDATAWQQFVDIFEALIDSRDDFTNLQNLGIYEVT